jgi:hypothetical protein
MRYAAVAFALLLGGPAFAQTAPAPLNPGAFAPFVAPGAPQCVPLQEVQRTAASLTMLDGAAFEFVRGLYIYLPPLAKPAPLGDRAAVAVAVDRYGHVMLMVVDGIETCARYIEPDSIVQILKGL